MGRVMGEVECVRGIENDETVCKTSSGSAARLACKIAQEDS